MTDKKNELPLIKCLPREDFEGGMKFWCPFCKTSHKHDRDDGHRAAHCTVESNSPFKAHGYIIQMMTKAELKATRKAIDDYLESIKPTAEDLLKQEEAAAVYVQEHYKNYKQNKDGFWTPEGK